MALIHSMRLSLMKGAHATLSSTARQEIGVKPYFGLSGKMALDRPLPVCHDRKRGTHFIPLPGFFRKLFMPDWVEILDLP